MEMFLKQFTSQFIFWLAWIVIPLIVEIIPAIGGFFILIKMKLFTLRKEKDITFFPDVAIIIPVYNSQETLYKCLQSIDESNYDHEKISILLVNNQTPDKSFDVFAGSQKMFKNLNMQWLNAKQGKSKALNMAIFNTSAKYIINIDSDGKLHPDAIKNMVRKFENNKDIHTLTGIVLTDFNKIDETKDFMLKIIRETEFFEYCQSFLAGRNYQSELNNVYTLAGAFSAFRKSSLMKSQLFNTDTVSEDTQITFQMRKMHSNGIRVCENAFFQVDPIECMNKLYTQRQRWQRGEIEVSNMFLKNELRVLNGFSNFVVRILIFDHTFAFPRMIWYFALLYLTFMNYPIKLVIGSIAFIYLLYVLTALLYYINVCTYLLNTKDILKYYYKKWYLIFILPIYNFVVFWFRFAGIINCIKRESAWKTYTFNEEWENFKMTVSSDFFIFRKIIAKLRNIVEN